MTLTNTAPQPVTNPWEVEETNFPSTWPAEEKLRFLLNYALLAPSSHNSQPWLWKIVGDAVELYADRERALPIADPQHRELIISCGAALLHLRLAIRHFGYQEVVEILPDLQNPDFLARVSLGNKRPPTWQEHQLFQAIRSRHTKRTCFEERPLPPNILSELKEAARKEGAILRPITEEIERSVVIDLIVQGDLIQGQNKEFREELSAWMQHNRSDRRDGIPGYAMGMNTLTSYIAPLATRSFDVGGGRATRDSQLAGTAPVLAVLETEFDTPRAWLTAGQALARVLLRARVNDVWASFFNQPIEVDVLKPELCRTLGLRCTPQILLRFGYCSDDSDVKPTPRRPANEVLR